MEPYFFTIIAVIITVIATIFLIPILLFRPLMLAISNRIAGKTGSADEIKKLTARVAMLEQQINDMHGRMGAIEDTSQFAHKVLEDVVKKTTPEPERK